MLKYLTSLFFCLTLSLHALSLVPPQEKPSLEQMASDLFEPLIFNDSNFDFEIDMFDEDIHSVDTLRGNPDFAEFRQAVIALIQKSFNAKEIHLLHHVHCSDEGRTAQEKYEAFDDAGTLLMKDFYNKARLNSFQESLDLLRNTN